MDNLVQTLSSAGLTDKEARVYIALLQLGKASAYGVSSRSGLKKPTTYVVLDELIKKGLASKIPRVKKQQYVAKPPEEFFANAEERLRQAKKALPELITMAESGEKVKVQTLFYEGLKGVEEALYFHTKEMRGKEIVGFYATGEDATPELLEVFTPWPKKMQEAGVEVKVITPEHESTKDFLAMGKQTGYDVKLVPTSLYSAKVSLEAGDDFVRIILFKPPQALIIRSPELANSVKQIFGLVSHNIGV